MNLFAEFEDSSLSDSEAFPEVAKMRPFRREELLKQEKDMIGLFLTGHILEDYAAYWQDYKLTPIRDLAGMKDRDKTHIAGIISHVKFKSNKNGQRFAQFDIEDLQEKIHCFVFARSLDSCKDLLVEDAILVIAGSLMVRDDSIAFSAQEVDLLSNIRAMGVPGTHGLSRTRKNEDIDYYAEVSFEEPPEPESYEAPPVEELPTCLLYTYPSPRDLG